MSSSSIRIIAMHTTTIGPQGTVLPRPSFTETATDVEAQSALPTEVKETGSRSGNDAHAPKNIDNGRVAGLDQILSTRDIVMITVRHRCTIYRWTRSGTFPKK